MRRLLLLPVRALAAWLATATAYLVALAAASLRELPAPVTGGAGLPVVVLVPAHDEAGQIEPTVAALLRQDHPASALHVVVIADNCADDTAALARAAGATTWERIDAGLRGKGHALSWAIERVWQTWPQTGAIAVVDADCEPTPDLVSSLAARIAAGADAVQADYRVANPGASGAAARRWAGFALMHRVRGGGKASLGLSCGLFGTGMAFSADLLRTQPWASHSVTEDAEQHIRFVRAGAVVRFEPGAAVLSPMPTTESAAATQQTRWESGKGALARATVGPLLTDAIRLRDVQRLHVAVEQLVPPQSALAAGSGACVAIGWAARDRRLAALATAALGGQAVYVVGGLAAVGAPAAVWRALATAPSLMARKLVQLALVASGRGERDWVRATREPSS